MVQDKHDKPILVVKLGSSTLTAGTDKISRGKIEDIARQIIELKEQYRVVIVSSGAIATAKQFINLKNWEGNIVASKQAMSAIGQPKLMQIYSEVFSDFRLSIAQCLLTYRDFEVDTLKKNTLNTILELLKHDYIPIINENDTVAVEEIILGDNDRLSAKVACLIDAKTLLLASDIDGVYTKNPHLHSDAKLIPHISDINAVKQFIEEKKGGLGTGGMTSKIIAAEECLAHDVETIITNGTASNFIVNALGGEVKCTRFITKSAV